MKKTLLHAVIPVAACLFIMLSMNSCKKSNKNVPFEKDWDVFYGKKTAGSNINELWSVHIDGTNDHKITIPLPDGWELMDQDMNEMVYPEIFVLARNSSLGQDAIFTCYPDGSNQKEILHTSSTENLKLQGYVSGSPLSMLYSKRNADNELELWQTNLDGANNQKFNVVLPANTYLADEEMVKVLNTNQIAIIISTRFDDPLNHNTTYPLYKCDTNGSNLSLLSAGESGSELAIQDVGYFSGALYRKVNNAAVNELWLVNMDGTNKHKIDLSLPAGVYLQNKEMAKVSQYDKSLIFLTTTASTGNSNGQEAIYSANIDGSNVKLIKRFPAGVDVAIQYFLQKQRID